MLAVHEVEQASHAVDALSAQLNDAREREGASIAYLLRGVLDRQVAALADPTHKPEVPAG